MPMSSTLLVGAAIIQVGVAFQPPASAATTTKMFSTTKEATEGLAYRADVSRAREMILQGTMPTKVQETGLRSEATVTPALSSVSPPVPPRTSAALPFTKAPAVLDGSLAGDSGFDPLGFSDSRENLLLYREAELKHARLAMLAAAGWPIAEMFQPYAAKTLGLSSALNVDGRNPSVLNGFSSHWQDPVFVVAVFAAVAAIEFGTFDRQFIAPKDRNARGALFKRMEAEGAVSGDFGFDPLGAAAFFGANQAGRKAMRTAEIKNGRLAMLAITGFAIQEFVLKEAVVDQTPIFFEPIWRVVADLMTGDALPPLYTQ